MRLKMMNKKGFTLIEIIVVIVILAVLMAVAVPAVLSYINEADDAKYFAQARGAFNYAQEAITKASLDGDELTSSELNTIMREASNISGTPKIEAVYFYDKDEKSLSLGENEIEDGVTFLKKIDYYLVVFIKAGTTDVRDRKFVKVHPNEKMELLMDGRVE